MSRPPGSSSNAGENTSLAYFLTFTCHGTWLHGDRGGSVDAWHRVVGGPRVPPSDHRVRLDAMRLRSQVVLLDENRRKVVDHSIRETCAALGWHLLALNVRTNHVHVVIAAPGKPERVMTALKAWSTRRLREAGAIGEGIRVWTRHGSTRYLWREEDVKAACGYVIYGQGERLLPPEGS